MKQHQKMIRRILWIMITLCLAMLLAGAAGAEDAVGCVPGEEGAAASEGGITNTEAMQGYIRQELQAAKQGSANDVRMNGTWVQNRMTGPSLRMCQYMRERISEVAAGKVTSTIFEIPVTAINKQISFTAKELGVARITNSNGSLNMDAVTAFLSKVKPDFTLVIPALLADCPYELYWYDKTIGYHYSYPPYFFTKEKIYYDQNAIFELRMTVEKEYAAWNGASSYQTSGAQAQTVQKAVTNAKKIVQENQGKSDVAKMKAYKDKICELTSYNDDAVSDRYRPYGNPWQLIWVFDGDPDTEVVCEGYSKAFQYLCDLSTFKGKIEVTTVTGYSNGNHMWNMVRMPDGKRYLVDVTNCEPGQVGYPDYLFLAGYSAVFDYEDEKQYCYPCGEWDSCYYIFNTIPTDLFAVESQNLSSKAYSQITVGAGIYQLYEKSGTATLVDLAEADAKELIVESKVEHEGKSYKVTAIGEEALRERRNLTRVTIGKNVQTIGKNAFLGCAKLKKITFAGSKLKKIGADAFRGIQSKATFYVPAKQYSAYVKMIKGAGNAENWKFKMK